MISLQRICLLFSAERLIWFVVKKAWSAKLEHLDLNFDLNFDVNLGLNLDLKQTRQFKTE